jgi:hypothetical protein
MPEPEPEPFPDLLDCADDLKEMLDEIDGLSGIDIIVDRQKNLDVQIQKAIGKSSGAMILILLDGWDTPPEGEATYLMLRFTISVWTRPILQEGNIAESTILALLLRSVQGYRPDPAQCYRWHVGAGQAVEDNRYRITAFTATYEFDLYPE